MYICSVPAEQSAGSAATTSKFSPNDLSLSPILVNMLVGETQHFSLFDYAGHKLTSQADWSVSDPSIAELTVVNGEPALPSKQTGTVTVRATVDARSSEATVHVITPEEMRPGTVRWQAPTRPGSKTIQVVPAVPSGGGSPPPSN